VSTPALWIRDGDRYVSTEITQGGWDPTVVNGGIVLALLGQHLDAVPTLAGMSISRFTADLVRPVPVGQPVRIHHEVVREGKKIQVVQLTLLADDVEHVRATALRLRHLEVPPDTVPPATTVDRPADLLVDPDDALSFRDVMSEVPGFLRAIELRVAPRRDGSSPSGCWLRLESEVVAGEPLTPTAALTFSFDYANLIGVNVFSDGLSMINPDVTAHVLRPPTPGWIAITGDTRFEPSVGRGVSTALLSDRDGVFAAVSTSQLLQPR